MQEKTGDEILNEDKFDASSFEDADPKNGLKGIKIRADNIENIPGTVIHWIEDIKNRKRDIQEFQNMNFLNRVLFILKRASCSEETNGIEVGKHHPTKKTKDLMRTLKRNPVDSFARLGLVSAVGKATRNFPVELYRSLFLQAMTACSLSDVSLQGLQIAVWSQNLYFSKLLEKLRLSYEQLEKILEAPISQGSGGYVEQRSALFQRLEKTKKNIKIIHAYQTHANKGIQDIKTNTTLTLQEITDTYIGTSDTEEVQDAKNRITKKMIAIISTMRYILLLHDAGNEFIDLFIQVNPHSPIGYFLKGRLAMSRMIFIVGRFENGQKDQQTKKDIQKAFKEAHHHYGNAVGKASSVGKGDIYTAIMLEYANTILYFYRIADSQLHMTLPQKWRHSVLQKARKSLIAIQESPKALPLMEELNRSMDNEGLL